MKTMYRFARDAIGGYNRAIGEPHLSICEISPNENEGNHNPCDFERLRLWREPKPKPRERKKHTQRTETEKRRYRLRGMNSVSEEISTLKKKDVVYGIRVPSLFDKTPWCNEKNLYRIRYKEWLRTFYSEPLLTKINDIAQYMEISPQGKHLKRVFKFVGYVEKRISQLDKEDPLRHEGIISQIYGLMERKMIPPYKFKPVKVFLDYFTNQYDKNSNALRDYALASI